MADTNEKPKALGIGGSVAGQIIGTGLGMATAGWQDRRQLKQEEKLQKLGIKGSKELSDYQQQLAMQMWHNTNYAAQRREMQKAGLNVGLMYEGGGAGGTTSGAGSANIGAGHAPAGGGELGMGMQLGLQMQMQQAQIENIKADTAKKKVDATKTAGVDTENVKAQIESTLQGVTNAKAQNELMQLQKQMNNIQIGVAQGTASELIQQAQTLTDKLIAETASAEAKGYVDTSTMETLIEQYKQNLEATKAGITATKVGTEATKTGIEATKAGIEQTKQNTKNLAQDEINKFLANQMRANGIEPQDHTAVRMIQRWLGENNVSLESVTRKMSKIGAWLKGQSGEQTMERLKEIMQE